MLFLSVVLLAALHAAPRCSPEVVVQGGGLRTWSHRCSDRVQVVLRSDGRPFDAEVELWKGPNNTPFRVRVYGDNGWLRPFNCAIETPRGPNTIAVRNLGPIALPIAAGVSSERVSRPSPESSSNSQLVQGGASRNYPLDSNVRNVEVMLHARGNPMYARVEILQGPDASRQVLQLYSEDGYKRPLYCCFATPGCGNLVRVVNVAPVEFPLSVSLVPHSEGAHM